MKSRKSVAETTVSETPRVQKLPARETPRPTRSSPDHPNRVVTYMLDVVREGARVIALTVAAAVSIAVLYLLLGPKTYTASAKLEVNSSAANVFTLSPVPASGTSEMGFVETQLEILSSEHIARMVVTALNLTSDLTPGGAVLSQDPGDRGTTVEQNKTVRTDVVRSLQNSLRIERIGLSSVLEVRYRGGSAEAAALIVNAVVESYLNDQIASRKRLLQNGIAWVKSSLAQNEVKLQSAEQAVQKFMRENRLSSESVADAGEQRELTDYLQQLAVARANAVAVQARDMDTQSASRDFEIAQKQVQLLEQGLEDLKKSANERRKAASGLERLGQERAALIQLQGQLLTKLGELEAQTEAENSPARIVYSAAAPVAPTFPKPLLTLAVAVVGGLGAGLMLVFALDRSRGSYRFASDIEAAFNLPVIAELPMAFSDARSTSAANTSSAWSLIAKAQTHYDYYVGLLDSRRHHCDVDQVLFLLKHELLKKRSGRGGLVVAIVSPRSGDGRTTICEMIVRYAQATKTSAMFVDADFRGKRNRASSPASCLALDDVIRKPSLLDQAFVTKGDLMNALASSQSGPIDYPQEFLASTNFRQVLSACASAHDLVIVDTPPMCDFVDASAILQAVDLAVMVIVRGSTSGGDIARSLHRLGGEAAKIAGVMMVDLPDGKRSVF